MKDNVVKFRCSASEKKVIRALSDKTGFNMSEYCRQQALSGKVYAVPKLTAQEQEYFKILKTERKN